MEEKSSNKNKIVLTFILPFSTIILYLSARHGEIIATVELPVMVIDFPELDWVSGIQMVQRFVKEQ